MQAVTTRPITGEQIACYQGGSWPRFYCSKSCLLPYRDFRLSFPHLSNKTQVGTRRPAVIPSVERGGKIIERWSETREYIAGTVKKCNFRLGNRSASERSTSWRTMTEIRELDGSQMFGGWTTSGHAQVASPLVSLLKRSRFGAGVPPWPTSSIKGPILKKIQKHPIVIIHKQRQPGASKISSNPFNSSQMDSDEVELCQS